MELSLKDRILELLDILEAKYQVTSGWTVTVYIDPVIRDIERVSSDLVRIGTVVSDAWFLSTPSPPFKEVATWKKLGDYKRYSGYYIARRPDKVSVEDKLLIEESYEYGERRITFWSLEGGLLGQGWIRSKRFSQELWILAFIKTRFPSFLFKFMICRIP